MVLSHISFLNINNKKGDALWPNYHQKNYQNRF